MKRYRIVGGPVVAGDPASPVGAGSPAGSPRNAKHRIVGIAAVGRDALPDRDLRPLPPECEIASMLRVHPASDSEPTATSRETDRGRPA